MADFAIGSDGYTPAVITASTRWFRANAAGVDIVANTDWLSTVVTVGLNVPYDPFSYGANMWTLTAAASAAFYKMRGMDAVINGLYDTWLVQGGPDEDGSEYAGALATPLRDIVVIDSWEV